MSARAARWVLWIFSCALSVSLIAHASGYKEFGASVAVVAVGLAVALGYLFKKTLAERVAEDAAAPVAWPTLGLALLIGAGIYYVLPVRSDVFPRAAQLIVVNAGASADAGKGEVWAKVALAGDRWVKPAAPIPNGWELRDKGTVVSGNPSAAVLSWAVPLGKSAELVLTRHPWSGAAEVTWLGRKQRFELNGPEGAQPMRFPLQGRPAKTTFDACIAALVAASDTFVLAFFLFLLILRARNVRR